VAGECRGSQATVLMVPRVQSRVVAEAAGEWRERGHGTRIWSWMRDGAASQWRWR
jgi:hypothetical protein